VRPDVSVDLAAPVIKMDAKGPERRFQQWKEVTVGFDCMNCSPSAEFSPVVTARNPAWKAMTKAIDQLAELVRQAEAKTRARKIESETQQAAEKFRVAEERAHRVVERQRVARPTNLRILEQSATDEQLLKDLIRKLAIYKSSLNSGADAEKLIAESQSEIERTRNQSRAELEEISREVDEARRELRVAIDAYRQLRRELDRLQPELGVKFAAEDRLLWDAEAHFPGGQLQLLANDVDAGLNAFQSLGKLEQYARLKVWIGRFRLYQATQDEESDLTEEHEALSHRVFHQLKWLSRQYEPGYIEAFRQDFSTDWSSYLAEAQEQLHQAIEASRRVRGADHHLPRRAHDISNERIPQDVFPRVVGLIHPEPSSQNAAALSDVQAPSPSLATGALAERIHLPDGREQVLPAPRQIEVRHLEVAVPDSAGQGGPAESGSTTDPSTAETTVKRPLAWIAGRDVEEPALWVGSRYILKLQMGDTGLKTFVQRTEGTIPIRTIPPEGLWTDWVLSSETIELSIEDREVTVVCDEMPGGQPVWTARFRLLVPWEGDSELRRLGITPRSRHAANLAVVLFASAEATREERLREPYRRFTIELPIAPE
jgi:hypothetical protein